MGRINIPITRPYFKSEEKQAIDQVIESGWVTQGACVEQFEKAVARYIGVKHAVACSNCTTALHIALILKGVGLGDEVIIGQTVLEKLDLFVDCIHQRVVPNPAHPDQPVSKVK